MSADELVQKLMAARNKTTARLHDISFNAGLYTAVSLVREHFGGRQVVEGKPFEIPTREELIAQSQRTEQA